MVLVGVLKGALIFLADLVRAIPDIDVEVDFMSISRFAPDSGRVRILHDLDSDIGGRDVVVVEDIVDTGLTLAYLIGQLAAAGPRRLRRVRAARPARPPHRPAGRCATAASSSPTNTCSGTACTSATCTATFRTSSPPTATCSWPGPTPTSPTLYRRRRMAPEPAVG